MKRLIMCEGPNELTVMRILLANEALVFAETDLIGLTPYHARQISGNAVLTNELNMYPENDVVVMRIGDKQSDKLSIPKEYREKIIRVEKYCTKPELEVLLIISEGLWSEFCKVKSHLKPKDFAKAHICINKRRYDNKSSFYNEYYSNNPDRLISSIKQYKKLHKTHQKSEGYLADLLR